MARIAFVVFSMALIISIQFMGGQSKEETPKEEKKDNKESVPGVNREEDKQVTEKEVMKDISEGHQDLEASSSPQQEEEFLMKIFFKTMKNMAAEGRLDPKVLKERLFSRGGETIDPKIKRAIIEAYGLIQEEKVEDGLWQIVGRYGEVLSVYIPKRRSREGTSCILVSCAMYFLKVPKVKCVYSKMSWKSKIVCPTLNENTLSKEVDQVCASRKEVMGHMDEDDLQWSYLKEIFVDIMLWKESIYQMERVVWIEIDGLPLHCWNEVSLKRLVGLWGRFEVFGENVKHHIDCEKVNMLISTSAEARIDETVDVVVENKKFIVRVLEVGMVDHSLVKLSKYEIIKKKEIEDEKDGVEVGADKKGVSSANFSVDPSEASESRSSVDKKGSPLSGGGTFDFVCTGDSLGVRTKVKVGKLIEVGCGIEKDSNMVKPIIDGVSRLDDRVMDGAFVVGSPEIRLPQGMGLQAEDLMDLHNDSLAASRGKCDGIKLGLVNFTKKGRSLSDSDLKKMWVAAYVEADETLSVAKILCIMFVGPGRKVLEEFCVLEEGGVRMS
ncbi:hypothetical protein F3Y22_tig00110458pilonHSYRG00095 [Hibiscus syriacus]|uniref:DUF4283 domain-containing protein n=1 Tax=Hibiscus syriacus TaxID=106335 RepID=A0A6A3AMU7_HIBSY|nr:hypothetical protein F3Y22_tig00110458pilonHSYRG00095 [Hibiscus syriacus]